MIMDRSFKIYKLLYEINDSIIDKFKMDFHNKAINQDSIYNFQNKQLNIEFWIKNNSNVLIIFSSDISKTNDLICILKKNYQLEITEFLLTLDMLKCFKDKKVINKIFSITIQPKDQYYYSVYEEDELFDNKTIKTILKDKIATDIKEVTMYINNCIPFYYSSPNNFLYGRKVKDEDINISTKHLIEVF